MEYILEILNKHLSDELIALESADQMTAGQGFRMPNRTMQAFIESRRLAKERIPQLEKAIKHLTDLPND